MSHIHGIHDEAQEIQRSPRKTTRAKTNSKPIQQTVNLNADADFFIPLRDLQALFIGPTCPRIAPSSLLTRKRMWVLVIHKNILTHARFHVSGCELLGALGAPGIDSSCQEMVLAA